MLRRELFPFVIRVGMNPLLFLFVFTYVLPHMTGGASMNPTAAMSGAGGGFSTVLLPGLMAVGIMFSGIAAVALPLAQEFGITREIDDRVMCPLPVAAVAIEKICFSAVQSVIAACVVFPLAIWVPTVKPVVHVGSWPFLILVVALASLVAGALGLVIGTSVKPQQIGLIFGVVVIPITFLGCVYYPWAGASAYPGAAGWGAGEPDRLYERGVAGGSYACSAAYAALGDCGDAGGFSLPADRVRDPWVFAAGDRVVASRTKGRRRFPSGMTTRTATALNGDWRIG